MKVSILPQVNNECDISRLEDEMKVSVACIPGALNFLPVHVQSTWLLAIPQ